MSETYIKNPDRNKKANSDFSPFHKKIQAEPVRINLEKDEIGEFKEKISKNKNQFQETNIVEKMFNQSEIPSVGERADWINPEEIGIVPIKDVEIDVTGDVFSGKLESLVPKIVKEEIVEDDEFSLFSIKEKEYFLFFKDEVIASGPKNIIVNKIADLYSIYGEDFNVEEIAVFKRVSPTVGIILED